MGFLSFIVTWLDSVTHNFGLAVALSVLLFYAITVPFKFLSAKNRRKKKMCEPELAAIRKKYNANQMGVDHSDTPDMPPEVKRMSYNARDEAMAKEIQALYKKHDYHMWTGWIPTALTLVIIILGYAAIRQASPEGFWTLNLSAVRAAGGYSQEPTYFYIIGAMLISSILTPLVSAIIESCQKKKQNKSIKSVLIANAISAVFALGIAVWIAVSVTSAIALAITAFYLLSFCEKMVSYKTPKATDNT